MAAASVALVLACNPVAVVGSRYVATQWISASVGGVIVVDAAECPELAGAQLSIPAGALRNDLEITLELGGAPITSESERPAGDVAIWGPAGTQLVHPARLVLPFWMVPGELFVQAREEDGTRFTIEPSRVAVDAASGLLRFELVKLAAFQPGTRQVCTANADCAPAFSCVNGLCGRTPCNATATCPTPYECRQGYCH